MNGRCFLRDGDIVEVEVEGLGEVVNTVARHDPRGRAFLAGAGRRVRDRDGGGAAAAVARVYALDGDRVLVSTLAGRLKARDVERTGGRHLAVRGDERRSRRRPSPGRPRCSTPDIAGSPRSSRRAPRWTGHRRPDRSRAGRGRPRGRRHRDRADQADDLPLSQTAGGPPRRRSARRALQRRAAAPASRAPALPPRTAWPWAARTGRHGVRSSAVRRRPGYKRAAERPDHEPPAPDKGRRRGPRRGHAQTQRQASDERPPRNDADDGHQSHEQRDDAHLPEAVGLPPTTYSAARSSRLRPTSESSASDAAMWPASTAWSA